MRSKFTTALEESAFYQDVVIFAFDEESRSCDSSASAEEFDFDLIHCDAIKKGDDRIRTGGSGFADRCLTTWLRRHKCRLGKNGDSPKALFTIFNC